MDTFNHLTNQTILVVDDDYKTVDLINLYLENEGYQVISAYDGHSALRMARRHHPDLIVLDLMLPRMDGLDICQTLRAESDVPMIMLTARTTEEDKLTGLEIGADDYITKPFSPRELVARIKVVLRRTSSQSRESIPPKKIGALEIDFERYQVTLDDKLINLTPREFRLISTLASHPGRVFSRQELLEQAFGMDYTGLERTVDVHMMNLRKKIEADPSDPDFIQTVYGIGYKLVEGNHAA